MKLLFPLLPVSFYEQLTLIYDFSYAKPVHHYKYPPSLTQALIKIVRGRIPVLSSEELQLIESLGFIGSLEIDTHAIPLEYLIMDASIGGPSLWARTLHKYLIERGRQAVFISFSRREFFFGKERVDISKIPHRKISYTSICRSLLQELNPTNCIIIGRDLAARMFDLLPSQKTAIIETGYGEESLHSFCSFNKDIEHELIEELTFREQGYPWDSFAHRYAASKSVMSCINIIWSEPLAGKLQKKFPNAKVLFTPPCIRKDEVHRSGIEFPRNRVLKICRRKHRKHSNDSGRNCPLTILAGLGHHQSGVNSIDFLNIYPLLFCAQRMEHKVRVIFLTKEPEELQRQLLDEYHAIEIIPFVPQEEFFGLLSKIDVYYRVQNDASIPISVIESMNRGCVPIINKRCLETWSMMKEGRNVVTVKFGDSMELEQKLRRLVDKPSRIVSIGRHAEELTSMECNFEENLKYTGLI